MREQPNATIHLKGSNFAARLKLKQWSDGGNLAFVRREANYDLWQLGRVKTSEGEANLLAYSSSN